MVPTVKRLLVGKPLASREESHQRLGKVVGLAVFASDAISSTAYATEEILLVLVPLGGLSASIRYLIPLSLVVVGLLVIVVSSYRQTIYAYPGGGGSYVVSRENLGETPSLVAGAALLVDYTLTVAVSISAGVLAITSALPGLTTHRVGLGVAAIVVLMSANLRGVKESGRLFAGPTYVYVIALGATILLGLYRSYVGDLGLLPVNEGSIRELTDDGRLLAGITVLAVMRAFSSGAVALTGIEAISNGVPAFAPPESRNAARTLVAMGTILASFFFGISLLANRIEPTVEEGRSLLSIIATAVYGSDQSPFFFLLQAATAAVLLLAANTAFADFPRISSILASDGFLPRQLKNRGDRLVFSNGIIALSMVAALLVIGFGGVTTALIPLYAVGVFTGFTLSQLGMVRHHRRLRGPAWRRHSVINAIGAIATAIVLLVVVVSKFTIGAWIPTVLIPLIVVALKGVHRHYLGVASLLRVPESHRPGPHAQTVVVLFDRVHRGVLEALSYASLLKPDRLVAVAVVTDEDGVGQVRSQWRQHHLEGELKAIRSPSGELIRPVLGYLDQLQRLDPDGTITVIIPELVPTRWWGQLLHSQSTLVLKARLLFRPGTVVTSVPFHLGHPPPGRSPVPPPERT
ncbi:MAG: APC family permease [Acidimicrobiales bacterium]